MMLLKITKSILLHRVSLFAAALAVLSPSLSRDLFSDDLLQFNRDIRPILSNNCFECHGFDPNKREAGLRLDTANGAIAELDSGDGRAIVPGRPNESKLISRILSHDSDEQMPPADSGKSKLTPKEIKTLQTWILQGAKYERHWSFVAPKSSPQPKVRNTKWARNKIDYFVLERLEKESLDPSPAADRRTLIRRVALDVTGLPPTPSEIKRYLDDDTSDAYQRMVDRYLSSPRYGEHLARYWLDLARYADTSGYQYDRERTMWVWRDWVINAYNQNMPFNQFTIEQLAGDLLPDAQPQQILATGFNRNHPITIEGGVIDEEYRTEYVMDRVVTTSTVWMGLTTGCARCHDHKFDPISQKEFYSLFAFFNQVPERGLNGFTPNQKIASPLAEIQSAESLAEIENVKQKLTEWKAFIAEPNEVESEKWATSIANSKARGWEVLQPAQMSSSGGSRLEKQADHSIVAGGANPQKDIYEISAQTDQTEITAIRLQCLTHPSLPGGGPGRHSNSNFVLSEFELVAQSVVDPQKKQTIRFSKATADYSQNGYNIANTIDGNIANNNGWAVDGPTRKQPVTALFYASQPFGFQGGTRLQFRLRHEATFATHGIGRLRLSCTVDDPASIESGGIPASIRTIAAKAKEIRTPAEIKQLAASYQTVLDARKKSLEAELAQVIAANTTAYPATMVMQELPKPRTTHVLKLGQYDRKGEVVLADVPQVLLPMSETAPANRLGLARWLTDPKHPLTARVAVNRHWQRLFGTGLVKTAEDFGMQGEWPSHPELLDSLAVHFSSSGWNVKALQRLILNSATYRQSVKVSTMLLEKDPENRLLARGPRFRLDAEQIRDQALAVSGLLVEKLGGPSVYPYQPAGLWLELNNRPGYSRAYAASKGNGLYRRSMYTFWKRTVLSPMLTTFDAPGREFCTVRRSKTNTPLQALLLLQGKQYVEASRNLAERILTRGGESFESRIRFGFELATARMITEKESAIFARVYHERLAYFQKNVSAAESLLKIGDSPSNIELDIFEHAAWTEVSRLILNLDETVTKG